MKTLTPAICASLENFDKLPNCANVRLPTVCGLYGIGPATAWRWVKTGKIPPPKKLGPRVTVWNVGQLRISLTQTSA